MNINYNTLHLVKIINTGNRIMLSIHLMEKDNNDVMTRLCLQALF